MKKLSSAVFPLFSFSFCAYHVRRVIDRGAAGVPGDAPRLERNKGDLGASREGVWEAETGRRSRSSRRQRLVGLLLSFLFCSRGGNPARRRFHGEEEEEVGVCVFALGVLRVIEKRKKRSSNTGGEGKRKARRSKTEGIDK